MSQRRRWISGLTESSSRAPLDAERVIEAGERMLDEYGLPPELLLAVEANFVRLCAELADDPKDEPQAQAPLARQGAVMNLDAMRGQRKNAPTQTSRDRLLAWAWAMAFLAWPVGLVLGIVLLARERVGSGLAVLATSALIGTVLIALAAL